MKNIGPAVVLLMGLLLACSVPTQDNSDIFQETISELNTLDDFERIECRTKRAESLQTVCFEETHLAIDAQPISEGPFKEVGASTGMFTISRAFKAKENWKIDMYSNRWINLPSDLPVRHGTYWALHGNYSLEDKSNNIEYHISQSTLHPVENNGWRLDTSKTSEHILNFAIINTAENPK